MTRDMKLALVELQCEESVARTAIACDEQNNFSMFVRLRIFERHGEWNYDRDDELRKICWNCGTHCPFCSDEKDVISIWRRTWELHGKKIRTPFCSNEDRCQDGCQHAREASNLLVQRHEFYKTEGQLLQRIQKMSYSIRHHGAE